MIFRQFSPQDMKTLEQSFNMPLKLSDDEKEDKS